jgi:hypothetical protein
MKKSLTIIALLAGGAAVYAQGQIEFTDYVGPYEGSAQEFQINVYAPQTGSASSEMTGNGPEDLPSSAQTGYTGLPLGGSSTGSGATGYGNGNDYTIQLYAAPGANATVLYPIAGATSQFYTFGAQFAGQFTANTAITLSAQADGFAGIAPDAEGTFQLRAWYSGDGTSSYEAAVAAGLPAGEDSPENIALGTGDNVVSLNPLTSFSLTITEPTPEPTTIALSVMGAFAFLFRRRSK